VITEATACVQQLRDLLECAWPPGVLSAAAKPFESTNWCAALAVVLDGCNGHPERLAGGGLARFEAAVIRELARWGGSRRRRCWLRPATPPASRARARWSTTPGCAPATTAAARSRAGPAFPDGAGLGCGWPPGARCGGHWRRAGARCRGFKLRGERRFADLRLCGCLTNVAKGSVSFSRRIYKGYRVE
jgi:hypothetical protein